MAAPDLPTEYDEIVLGTGLQESILAAALARIGHRVLHLDRNDYYSGDWATFHLRSLQEWIDRNKTPQEEVGEEDATSDPGAGETEPQGEGESFLELPQNPRTVTGVEVACYVSEGVELPSLERLIVPPASLPTEGAAAAVAATGAEGQAGPSDTPAGGGSGGQSEEVARASAGLPSGTGAGDEETESEALQNSANEDRASTSAVSPMISLDQPEAGAGVAGADAQEAGVADPARDPAHDPEPNREQPEQAAAAQQGTEGQGSDAAASGRRKWTWSEISQQWRRFNIDLAPKLMFCRGSMIEVLVTSRISRYAEFKAVTRILTLMEDKLELVPCSRSDVFSSKYVSMLEKRMLMRLIEFTLNYQDRLEEFQEFRDKPFEEFLKSRKLTPTLQHFVVHSIAMVTASAPTEEALKSMQFFLRSLGRYGNTAFLWTLYGSGELPQCFCRMCAVFAGIYMLRTSIKKLVVDQNNSCIAAIDTEGRRLTCNHLIMERSYAPLQAASATLGCVSRGILLTDRSLKPTENDEITLLTVPPPAGQTSPVRVLELGPGSCACPKDLFVVHLTCSGTGQARGDLQTALDELFQPLNSDEPDETSAKPKVLWSLFFSQTDSAGCEDSDLAAGLPSNVLVTGGPGTSVGFEHAVAQAKRLFERICPGEDFLPAAPEPEDIIFEDQSANNPGEHKEVGFEASAPTEGSEKSDTENKTDKQTGDPEDSSPEGNTCEEQVREDNESAQKEIDS